MIKRWMLDNGIRVVTEEMKHIHSVSIGIWVKVGSYNETASNNGVSHFIEHMMFKGTTKRSAKEIAEAIDGIGGDLGAFTAREYTCFYAKVAEKYLDFTIEVLADMFFNSLFETEEIEREKEVVLEEIRMYEDTPDELVHDFFIQTIWNQHSLGQPIIGRHEVVKDLSRKDLLDFKSAFYTPKNIVISIAGSFSYPKVLDSLNQHFGGFLAQERPVWLESPKICPRITVKERDLEQMHICIGTRGLSFTDEKRFVLSILDTILGHGMSSRLFQEIREKHALAYSVHSYTSSFRPCGLFTVYLGTAPGKFHHAVDVVMKELSALKRNKIDEKEISKAKEQVKGSLILGLESTGFRMTRLAKNEIYFNKQFGVEEILDSINSVQAHEVQALAQELFHSKYLTLTCIGPLSASECETIELKC